MSTAEFPSGIITPEAIVLDVETAGFASRILAGIVDLCAMSLLLLVGAGALTTALGADTSTEQTVVAFVTFLVIFGYPIAFETLLRGRTPGKIALGLRAVTVDGAPIRLREAALRAMGGVVDKLVPPGGITGAVFVATTPRNQRVGDLIAGTIVIRDPSRYVASPALWFSAPAGHERYAESIDPSAITVEQYTLVRNFLTRAPTFSPAVRAALADDLARRLADTIRFTESRAVPADVFLVCAIARYQRRFGPGRAIVPAVASDSKDVASDSTVVAVGGPARDTGWSR